MFESPGITVFSDARLYYATVDQDRLRRLSGNQIQKDCVDEDFDAAVQCNHEVVSLPPHRVRATMTEPEPELVPRDPCLEPTDRSTVRDSLDGSG